MLDCFTWYYIERLVLSAFEQPTTKVVGCFVIGVAPSLLERAPITK